MGGGFQLTATELDGRIRRYENGRLRAAIRQIDDTGDPMDAFMTITMKLPSPLSYSATPTPEGIQVSCKIDCASGFMGRGTVSFILEHLRLAEQDLDDLGALLQEVYPGAKII